MENLTQSKDMSSLNVEISLISATSLGLMHTSFEHYPSLEMKDNRMDKKWNWSPLQTNKHTLPKTMIFDTDEYPMLSLINNPKWAQQGTDKTIDNTKAMETSPITPSAKNSELKL